MTPTFMNSSSFFSNDLKQDQLINFTTLNPNSSPSSSSDPSYNFFSDSTTRDHKDPREGDDLETHGGSYQIENGNDDSGFKFSIWKEDPITMNENQSETNNFATNIHQVKWMSSKMRLMHKMKKSDRTVLNSPTTITNTLKVEDDHQKQPSISHLENDYSSTNSNSNNSIPIRVCSDCNTTKTPLWRSGPHGPKSLCNACGIRQRKARRAMATATATATTTTTTNGTIIPTQTPIVKIPKSPQKDKHSNGQKRCKIEMTPSTPTQVREKLRFEDFLMNLSNNLAFHRVFPQDEKEAAILLMAISCGHVHG